MIMITFILLLLLSEEKCSASPAAVSELLNPLIRKLTSSSSSNDTIELAMADVQLIHRWVGQVARQIVIDDGTFIGIFTCAKNLKPNDIDLLAGLSQDQRNKIGKFEGNVNTNELVKVVLSFGALLSAQVEYKMRENAVKNGEPVQGNNYHLRMLLQAYECFTSNADATDKYMVPGFVIRPVIKHDRQLNSEKVLLEMQPSEKKRVRQYDDFALLCSLNIEMNASEVLKFAAFVHSNFFNDIGVSAMIESFAYFFNFKQYNLFNKNLKENRLTIESIDKDPHIFRRVAHLLLFRLKNWGLKEWKKSLLKKLYDSELTAREKCFLAIFVQNLVRKVVNDKLAYQYFYELNQIQIQNFVEIEQDYFARVFNQICRDSAGQLNKHIFIDRVGVSGQGQEQCEKEDEADATIYWHYDDAIRINWNIWNETTKQIEKITKKISENHRQQKLVEYLKESKNFGEMSVLSANFITKEFGELELKVEEQKIMGLKLEVVPKDQVKKFCATLAKIKQKITEEGRIVKYEKERNIVLKQKENYDQFYSFLGILSEHFGGNFIKNKKIAISLDDANALLKQLQILAETILMRKKFNEKVNFTNAIHIILGKDRDENLENLFTQFFAPQITNQKYSLEQFVNAQLLHLLFSFGTRLEAIAYGKKINDDLTVEEKRVKDVQDSGTRIQAFFSVLKELNVPEWANKFGIFDYWMEIEDLNSTTDDQSLPILRIGIYKKYAEKNEEALHIARANFEMLMALNKHQFSIYETTKLLRIIYDKIDSFRYMSKDLTTLKIADNLIGQIKWESGFKCSDYINKIQSCQFAKLFQNISTNFMEMFTKQGIDPEMHLHWVDNNMRNKNDKDIQKYCKGRNKLDEKGKIASLSSVRYDLVVRFKFNRWKDILDRTEDELLVWNDQYHIGDGGSFDEKRKTELIEEIWLYFDSSARKRIEKIESLINKGEDAFVAIALLKLFDEIKELVEEEFGKMEKKLEKAKRYDKMLKQLKNMAKMVDQNDD